MKKIMFIGYGAMAKTVEKLLPTGTQLSWLLVTPQSVATIQAEVGESIQVISSVEDVIGEPDLVVEMSGQNGLKAHAFSVLEKAWNLGVVSVGAFADDDFYQAAQKAAQDSGCQIFILSGAVAGMDGMVAAKALGLNKVVYQGCKKPNSWAGSYAEQLVDLKNLTEKTVFFTGTAREAATLFPANANVAATIALAGVGMDKTQVELIADPDIRRNQHMIHVEGEFGEMQLTMSGIPLASNPKTSTLAALSVVRLCQQLASAVVI